MKAKLSKFIDYDVRPCKTEFDKKHILKSPKQLTFPHFFTFPHIFVLTIRSRSEHGETGFLGPLAGYSFHIGKEELYMTRTETIHVQKRQDTLRYVGVGLYHHRVDDYRVLEYNEGIWDH